MCWCCWSLHTAVIGADSRIFMSGRILSSESSKSFVEETLCWCLILASLCLVLTTRDCSSEAVELLPFEVYSTLTLCLRIMEVKFFSWSQKVFVNLSIFEDMAACYTISVFRLTLTELSTFVIAEFWMVFWTRWFELVGVSSGKLLVSSSSRDILYTT